MPKGTEKGKAPATGTSKGRAMDFSVVKPFDPLPEKDESGKPFITGSCGMYGFSGTRKSTPYAATTTADSVIRKAIGEHGLKEADIYIKGIGPGRGACLRAIKSIELEVNKIIDTTPVPHNGVRPPKIRRV